jgi:hypothetical protein
MNNNTLTIAAIAAFAALLATGAVMTSNNAFAGGHQYKKTVTQTSAQANACGNGKFPDDIFCQTLGNQVKGNDNAVNVIGVQPSGLKELDHGGDHGNDHGDHNNDGGGPPK